jgi:tetratricopeptide (TPR) repeat protein
MKIRIAALVAAALFVGACDDGSKNAERMTIAEAGAGEDRLPAEVREPIDMGNAAYRAKDFETALAYYRQAADRAPDEPTTWFGVAMAAEALGNQPLADSARARIDLLAPDLNVAGHTEATSGGHPGGVAPNGHPMTMPSGHP